MRRFLRTSLVSPSSAITMTVSKNRSTAGRNSAISLNASRYCPDLCRCTFLALGCLRVQLSLSPFSKQVRIYGRKLPAALRPGFFDDFPDAFEMRQPRALKFLVLRMAWIASILRHGLDQIIRPGSKRRVDFVVGHFPTLLEHKPCAVQQEIQNLFLNPGETAKFCADPSKAIERDDHG